MTTKSLRTLALAVAASQLMGCGYILYPERVGQPKGGRIDPTVAILDGVGCLLFLIPGLVAFAVDFYHGTIYLPPDGAAVLPTSQWRRLELGPGPVDAARIETAMRAAGYTVSLSDPRLAAYRARRLEDLPAP